jgi:hypothetical protein
MPAAAALVIALTLSACADSTPSASAVASTSGPATSSPSPQPAHWVVTQLPAPEGVAACVPDDGGLQNLRVLAFGSGLLALGSCAHSASPSWVWVSPNGRSWQATAPAGLAHADVFDLTVIDGLIIAAGQDVSDGSAAAAWTSRDGLTWARSNGEIGCGVMQTVTRFGSELLAFGNTVPNIPEFEVPPGVCEWVSTNGLDWKRVDLPNDVFPANTGVSSVTSGPGGLIAVGYDAGPDHTVGALWGSPDGRVWIRRPAPGETEWLSLDLALPDGNGFVILGTPFSGNGPRLATSPDGLGWTSVSAPGQGGLSDGPSFDGGPAGFIFGGQAVSGGPESPTMVWTSPDASRWSVTPALPVGLAYHAVASAAGDLLVAASTPGGRAAIVRLKP